MGNLNNGTLERNESRRVALVTGGSPGYRPRLRCRSGGGRL